jgi:alpha-glucosidase
MVWQSDNQSGGFTSGKPWLPVPAAHLNQAGQKGADSLFAHYQSALALRNRYPVLRHGAQSAMQALGDLLQFIRHDSEGAVFCAFNLGDGQVQVALPQGAWQGQNGDTLASAITLGPWQTCLAVKQ